MLDLVQVQWLVLSNALQFVLLTMLIVGHAPKESPPLLGECVTAKAGSVVLLVAAQRISAAQAPAVKKYVDELSAESGLKFVLIDGAFSPLLIGEAK